MATLRDDTYLRGRVSRHRHTISGLHCALIFIAAALLVMNRIDHPLSKQLRSYIHAYASVPLEAADEMVAPMRRFWQRAVRLADGSDEVARLRAENTQLKGWKRRVVELERRLDEMGRLANVARARQIDVITARILADGQGPYRRALLIDAGSNHGVHNGFPVLSSEGLIGRTIETSDRAARVLLFDDINSRVPVRVGRKLVRAIAAGDGQGMPRLIYLPRGAEIEIGDRVTTSGAAGVFPAGFELGEVVRTGKLYRVRLLAGKSPYRYVSVHRYAGPGSPLTGFLAAKAFERQLERLQGRAGRERGPEHLAEELRRGKSVRPEATFR